MMPYSKLSNRKGKQNGTAVKITIFFIYAMISIIKTPQDAEVDSREGIDRNIIK